MKQTKSFWQDKRGQGNTILALVTAGIMILIGIFILSSVFTSAPDVPVAVSNESWVFNISDSGTWTKTLTYGNVLVTPTVKVYNSTWNGVLNTDFNISSYSSGTIVNGTATAMAVDTYGVDYSYEEAGYVTAQATVRTTVFAALSLAIVGILVMAAVLIIRIVQSMGR